LPGCFCYVSVGHSLSSMQAFASGKETSGMPMVLTGLNTVVAIFIFVGLAFYARKVVDDEMEQAGSSSDLQTDGSAE